MSAPTSTKAPRELTRDEAELLANYRGMTPWARGMLLDTSRQYIQKWPAAKPALRLRLVPAWAEAKPRR